MADLNPETYERWWKETREYTWDSLRTALDKIYQEQTIDRTTYRDLSLIITRLQDMKVNFPLTPKELEDRINPYL